LGPQSTELSPSSQVKKNQSRCYSIIGLFSTCILQRTVLNNIMCDEIAAPYAQIHHDMPILESSETPDPAIQKSRYDLFKEGTPHPQAQAHEIYNADEVGFDPTGRWRRVMDKHLLKNQDGGKAPFWSTPYVGQTNHYLFIDGHHSHFSTEAGADRTLLTTIRSMTLSVTSIIFSVCRQFCMRWVS
jgi:hypothetical protein